MLPEDKRQQLDKIVQSMVLNRESDANIKAVVADFKQKYANTNTISSPSSSVGSGVSVKEPWYSKPIAPASTSDSPVMGAVKTAINVVGDIPNTVKGFFDFLNPIPKLNPLEVDNPQSIAGNIGRATDEIYNAYKEGNLSQTLVGTAKEIIPETIKSFVPKFLQQAVEGDFESARQTITNHPTSEILPMLLVARGVAEKTGYVKQFDNTISKIASPVTVPSSIIGGGIKTGVKELSTGGAGTATGIGKESMVQALKGGEEFTKALRGKTDLTQVLGEAQSGLGKVKQIRGDAYQTAMSNLKILNPQSLDISPVASKARELLQQFNVKIKPEGLDFSRSPLINDSKKIEGVLSLINDWGLQAGDRTVAGVDMLKRQLRDFREPTNPTLNKFVDSLAGEARTVASKAKGYDAIQKEYGQYSDFINELEKTLSLRESATPDTAINKLNSLLRENADYKRQLTEELKAVTGEDILAPIAGKALNRWTPQGFAKYVALGAGGIMPHIIPYLAVSSPRLMGEFFRLVGMTNRVVAPILSDINNFRATTGLAPIKLKVQNYLKNPKLGMSIEDVTKGKSPSIQKAKASGQSFDEWVKGQPTYYHGTPEKTFKLDSNKPLFLTNDFDSANTYAGYSYGVKPTGKVFEVKIKDGKTLNLNDNATTKKVFEDVFGSDKNKKLFDEIPESYTTKERGYNLKPRESVGDFQDWLWDKYPSSENKPLRGTFIEAYTAYGKPSRNMVYDKWSEIIDYAKKKGYDFIDHTTEDPSASIVFPEKVVLNPKKSITTHSQLKAEWDKIK